MSKIITYLNVHKTIAQSMKAIDVPMVGMFKFWIFWGVSLFLVALFILTIFWAFGNFMLEPLPVGRGSDALEF